MRNNGHDKIFTLCSQLIRIDNRPVADLSQATGLCLSTIYRLKKGGSGFMRSSTAASIARAAHYSIRIERRGS